MNIIPQIACVFLALIVVLPVAAGADTYVIPFSDILQAVDKSCDSPDSVMRAYLTGLIRDELEALGFDVNGGLVFGEIPVEELTQIIETDCDFPSPYEMHTDTTNLSQVNVRFRPNEALVV